VYGLLLPLLGYRIFNRRSRTMMLANSLIFGIERIVIFSLRAAQSRQIAMRESKNLNAYMQLTIGMGFVAVCQDMVGLVRVALVNTTLPSVNCDSSCSIMTSGSSTRSLITFSSSGLGAAESAQEEDKLRERYWYRRLSDFLRLGFIGAQVPGILGNSDYANAVTMIHATFVFRLRYAGSAIALFFSMALAATAWWAKTNVPRFKKNAAYLTLFICGLFSITSIYRLCVMWNTTTSLTSTAPGSQNTPGEKAAFYIFHIVPEWISLLTLLSFNVRDVFGTGMFSDRARDETEGEKETKKAKELYKYEEETGRNVGIRDEDFGLFSKGSHLWRGKE